MCHVMHEWTYRDDRSRLRGAMAESAVRHSQQAAATARSIAEAEQTIASTHAELSRLRGEAANLRRERRLDESAAATASVERLDGAHRRPGCQPLPTACSRAPVGHMHQCRAPCGSACPGGAAVRTEAVARYRKADP